MVLVVGIIPMEGNSPSWWWRRSQSILIQRGRCHHRHLLTHCHHSAAVLAHRGRHYLVDSSLRAAFSLVEGTWYFRKQGMIVTAIASTRQPKLPNSASEVVGCTSLGPKASQDGCFELVCYPRYANDRKPFDVVRREDLLIRSFKSIFRFWYSVAIM